MKIHKYKLDNGIRLIVVPVKRLKSATVTVWVKAGSRDESKEIFGISHFLEHMAFKGGKKYKTALEVSQAVDGFGGQFNASTGSMRTQYYIRAGSEHIDKAFDILSDMILAARLRPSDIERERGVIIEEIGMYEDNPKSVVWMNFDELICKGTKYEHDVIGNRKTVSLMKKSDFVSYMKKHYVPENVVITVSGGVDTKQIFDLANKYFGGLKGGSSQSQEVNYTNKNGIFKVKNKNRLAFQYKKTEQANIVLGFPGLEYGNDRRYINGRLSVILGSGMSSRLFTEVREKRGLAYSVHADVTTLLGAGYFAVYAGVDPKKAIDAIIIIKKELSKIADKKGNKLTKKEMLKAKEYSKGHFTLSLESTGALNGLYGQEELLLNRMITPEEIIKGYEDVTSSQVIALAEELFDPSKMYLSVVGPFKDKSKFEKLLD